ncbi:hypothetical protein DPMN_193969 [Dreissena polymorpha]|uniref:Uncharacterized protein n=1 Tax=Dreissena polymorpha TaxID=45954 RepID=A0A9D3Y5A9_DREPO|nr:hypothetical protein DPMN_193969 [Dreissena polymorpha]
MSKFHEDWEKNVSSKLFTCCHYMYIHIKKTAPLPGCHVFSLIRTIFKLVQDIHITNVLTKFHDDKAKHVTSRVFTTDPSHYRTQLAVSFAYANEQVTGQLQNGGYHNK